MVWQDFAIATDAFILAISILPIVVSRKSKVPLLGSLPTAVGLGFLSLFFFTLGLVFSASAALVESLLWFFILFRRRLTSEAVSENKNSKVQKSDIELPMACGRCPKCLDFGGANGCDSPKGGEVQ